MVDEPIIKGTAPAGKPAGGGAVTDTPTGTTTIDDGLSFDVEQMAHQAAAELSAEIADAIAARALESIQPPTPVVEVIYLDDKLSTALTLHRTFIRQCEILEKSFRQTKRIALQGIEALANQEGEEPTKDPAPYFVRQLGTRPNPRAAVVSELQGDGTRSAPLSFGQFIADRAAPLEAAVNLLSFFNVDTEYHGRRATVSDRAFLMSLAEKLRLHDISFRWPSLALPIAAAEVDATSYFSKLNRTARSADEANNQVQTLATLVNSLEEDDPDLGFGKQVLSNAHQHYESSRVVLDDLRETFFGTPQRHGLTSSEMLLLAESVLRQGSGDDEKAGHTFFLVANIEKSGGDYRTRRHLWQALTGEPQLAFSGGSIVSYALLDRDAAFVTSDIVSTKLSYRSRFSNYFEDRPTGSFTAFAGVVVTAAALIALLVFGAYWLTQVIQNEYLLMAAAGVLAIFGYHGFRAVARNAALLRTRHASSDTAAENSKRTMNPKG